MHCFQVALPDSDSGLALDLAQSGLEPELEADPAQVEVERDAGDPDSGQAFVEAERDGLDFGLP